MNSGKPPRTVHIDVYCTGSDGDSLSSSMEDENSSSSDPSAMRDYHPSVHNAMESASNSTNPTVYESFDMKLKHKRAAREELPRKFLIDNTPRRTPSYSNVPSRSKLVDSVDHTQSIQARLLSFRCFVPDQTSGGVSEQGKLAETFIETQFQG